MLSDPNEPEAAGLAGIVSIAWLSGAQARPACPRPGGLSGLVLASPTEAAAPSLLSLLDGKDHHEAIAKGGVCPPVIREDHPPARPPPPLFSGFAALRTDQGVRWLLNCIPFTGPSPEVTEASAFSPASCGEETVLQDPVMTGELWDIGLFWPGLCPHALLTPSWAALAGGAHWDIAEALCSAPRLLDKSGNSDSHLSRRGCQERSCKRKSLFCRRLQQRPSSLLGVRGFAFGLCAPVELEGAVEGG